MSKQTSHSEYGTMESVLMKRPEEAFVRQELIDEQWKELNFLNRPVLHQAIAEHEEVRNLIKQSTTQVQCLPQASNVTLDSTYCRDAALVTDFGIIVCQMGKSERSNEPREERIFLESLGLPVLGEIKAPGTLEGGDVAWIDDHTLAVGHTYRTNQEGIQQLKDLLETRGIIVLVAEMPHYKGPSDVFHLMSVFSPVDEKKAVVYSPLMPIHFRQELVDRGFQLIEVPDEEFESMGCNVLAIAPSHCIMVAGNPVTKKRIQAAGCKVNTYEGQNISVYGGGGPTCLTRPILRTLPS